MTKKNYREIDFASNLGSKFKSDVNKRKMPTIRCVCGREILVIPDLKAMNRGIKNHIAEHKKADYGLALDSLEEFLTEQILIVASKMILPDASQ